MRRISSASISARRMMGMPRCCGGFELRIAALHCGRDDETGAPSRLAGSWPIRHADVAGAQAIEIGAVLEVAALDRVATGLHHLGDGAHADAADADDMDEAGHFAIGHVHDERYSLGLTSNPRRDRRAASRRRRVAIGHAPLSQRPPDAPARTADPAAFQPGARPKLGLAYAPAAANLLQPCCIFKLIVVKGVRQRNEEAGRPIVGQLRHGRGARAGDDELRRGDALRQVAEEGRDMRGDPGVGIGLANPREILLAGLLHHREPPAHVLRQALKRRRQRLGKEARALAAAEHEQQQAGGGIGRGVRRACETSGRRRAPG